MTPAKAVTTRGRITLLLASIALCATLNVVRADVLLQGFYWDVPSPAAGSAAAPWWWDHLSAQASDLARAGFTAIWIPPVTKGASGGYSVGYDPFDDYDLGSKNQRGTIPTRYGTREQVERCVATMRANGLGVYVDLVENHRNGDDGQFSFVYADAYGHTPGGRFAKGPMDFHPNVPQDPNVPEEAASFGRDIAHVNGQGGKIGAELMQAGDWLYRSLGVQGCRLDYAKGISTDWLKPFLRFGAVKGKFAVGEFYDGDLNKVRGWVQQSMGGTCTAFDFPLRYLLKEMCDTTSGFDMSRLDHAGLAGVDPAHAVTFVENHDTDRSDPVVWRKALAYAYILTAEGYPCVFYRDYSTDPGCYGLKPVLDKLLWVNAKLAVGGTQVVAKTPDVYAFERTGGRKLMVALTADTTSGHAVNVQTGFGPSVTLHDYAGNAPDMVTDDRGRATIAVPSNATGLGFVCYSVAGIAGQIHPRSYSVTQDYEGAADLDIPRIPVVDSRSTEAADPKAVTSTTPLAVCRLRIAGSTTLRYRLRVDTSSWTASSSAEVALVDATGVRVSGMAYRRSTHADSTVSARVRRSGEYTFTIAGHHTPSLNANPSFRVRVTYTAPRSETARP